MWGYDFLGDSAVAVALGKEYMAGARQHGLSPAGYLYAARELARLQMEADRPEDAEDTLRMALTGARADGWEANRAQRDLHRLSALHPEMAPADVLPPRLTKVLPREIVLRLPHGQRAVRTIALIGNSTLRAEAAHCASRHISAEVARRRFDGTADIQEVRLRIGPVEELGPRSAVVVVCTNAPDAAEVHIPVSIDVFDVTKVEPVEVFFGFVSPGQEMTAEIILHRRIPFRIVRLSTEHPASVTAAVVDEHVDWSRIDVALTAPEQVGIVEGKLTIVTEGGGVVSELEAPYYAHVVERRDANEN
jgi:hypothetical protein